ncbi:hypothetical protein PUNSTDRAFT_146471 [Punctularia strigosozonata HHB-11173 SS5]|uniref:Uncharacterized protein n=1 Tax=Punctularia strigosozonata (strain HHB-11173) TaxID=741275 RepID=R7S3Y6_PUNST|nr:uncharacterized protein PUNSTDRAFT_146471 [Punctularia strigosozonata HHB-11173 SS5]EIN04512.1 hypothetical protein PUNSTDRAFT_146471 [Punctularia strigosozonata HHB-11173 SS5]
MAIPSFPRQPPASPPASLLLSASAQRRARAANAVVLGVVSSPRSLLPTAPSATALAARARCRLPSRPRTPPSPEREPPTRSRSSPNALAPALRSAPSASRQCGRVRRRLPSRPRTPPSFEREPPTRSRSASPLTLAAPFARRRARAANAVAFGVASQPLAPPSSNAEREPPNAAPCSVRIGFGKADSAPFAPGKGNNVSSPIPTTPGALTKSPGTPSGVSGMDVQLQSTPTRALWIGVDDHSGWLGNTVVQTLFEKCFPTPRMSVVLT